MRNMPPRRYEDQHHNPNSRRPNESQPIGHNKRNQAPYIDSSEDEIVNNDFNRRQSRAKPSREPQIYIHNSGIHF
jgi:hypothetical protein